MPPGEEHMNSMITLCITASRQSASLLEKCINSLKVQLFKENPQSSIGYNLELLSHWICIYLGKGLKLCKDWLLRLGINHSHACFTASVTSSPGQPPSVSLWTSGWSCQLLHSQTHTDSQSWGHFTYVFP